MATAEEQERLIVTGNRRLEVDLGSLLSLGPFAKVKKLVP
jgi:hypothetical protein